MSKWDSIVVSIFNGRYKAEPGDSVYDEEVSYRTMGSHDYITITPMKDENGLPEMRTVTTLITKTLKPGESTLNLFAVATDSLSAEKFWQDDDRPPFLFISTVQLRFGTPCPSNDKFEEYVAQLKDCLKGIQGDGNGGFMEEISQFLGRSGRGIGNRRFRFQVYLSLDSGDLILFIKTYEYKFGEILMQYIQQKFGFLYYGYSLVGMDLERLAQTDEADSEIIPKVGVCSVVVDTNKYNGWFQDHFRQCYPSEQLPSQTNDKEGYIHLSRLGNEDICINIFNCRLSKLCGNLLNNGVFSHENKALQKACMRLRIHVDSEFVGFSAGGDPVQPAGISIMQGYTKIRNDLNLPVDSSTDRALMEIFTAFAQLETSNFALDVLDCVRNIYKVLINELYVFQENREDEGIPEDEKFSLEVFNKSLQYCATGIRSIVNGCLHADRMFFQCPGFNADVYHIPAKLMVFFAAYVHSFSECLIDEDDENDYRYLLSFDLYQRMDIDKLFKYHCFKNANLLKIRIPVDKLFVPDMLMQELAHEVAHVTGGSLMCRSERFECVLDMISHLVADRLLSINMSKYDLYREYTEVFAKLLNESSSKIREDLERYIRGEISQDFHKRANQDRGVKDNNRYILNYVKETMRDVMKDFMSDYKASRNLYNHICELFNKYKKDPIYNKLNVYQELFNVQIWLLNRELEDFIDAIATLTCESYADLIMLSVLGISEEQYIQLLIRILKTAGSPSTEDMLYHGYGERILSVLQAAFPGESLILTESPSELNMRDSEQKKFILALRQFQNPGNESRRILSNRAIYFNNQYLNKCKVRIEDLVRSGKLDSIRDLYASINSDSIVDSFRSMRIASYRFRAKLMKEILQGMLGDK